MGPRHHLVHAAGVNRAGEQHPIGCGVMQGRPSRQRRIVDRDGLREILGRIAVLAPGQATGSPTQRTRSVGNGCQSTVAIPPASSRRGCSPSWAPRSPRWSRDRPIGSRREAPASGQAHLDTVIRGQIRDEPPPPGDEELVVVGPYCWHSNTASTSGS